jgi:hypothetical protein
LAHLFFKKGVCLLLLKESKKKEKGRAKARPFGLEGS